MSFWVKGQNFVLGATKEEVIQYAEKARNGNTSISFEEYLKRENNIPKHQDIDVVIQHTNNNEDEIINLSDTDLSGGDFSNITFRNVRVNEGTKFDNAVLFGTQFHNVKLRKEHLSQPNIGPNTSIEGTDLDEKDLQSFAKTKNRSEALLYGPASQKVQEAISFFKSQRKSVFQQAASLTINHLKEKFTRKKTFNIDQVFASLRAASIKAPEGTDNSSETLDQVEELAADTITSLYKKRHVSTQTWGSYIQSFVREDVLNQRFQDLLITKLKEGDFLRKHYRIKEDLERTDDFFTKNIKEFRKDFTAFSKAYIPRHMKKETSKSFGFFSTTRTSKPGFEEIWQAFSIRKTNTSIAINSFKQGIEHKKRWQNLQQNIEKLDRKNIRKKKTRTWSEYLAELGLNQIPEAISPNKRSAWPKIDPKDEEARKNDLELKREGVRLLSQIPAITGGTIAGVLSNQLSSKLGRTTGGALGAYLGNQLATPISNTLTNKMTMENYDSFDNKFGDILLELGVAKRSLDDATTLLGNKIVNKILLGYTSENSFTSVTNILANAGILIGSYTAYNNATSVYDFIKAEKEKSSGVRKRPGTETFNAELDKKLIKIPLLAKIAAVSAFAVASVVLVATFAPTIAPFMATIAGLSTPALLTAGAAVTAAATIAGYLTYTRASYAAYSVKKYFSKTKKQKKGKYTTLSSRIIQQEREVHTEKTQTLNQPQTLTSSRTPVEGQHVQKLQRQRGQQPKTQAKEFQKTTTNPKTHREKLQQNRNKGRREQDITGGS